MASTDFANFYKSISIWLVNRLADTDVQKKSRHCSNDVFLRRPEK